MYIIPKRKGNEEMVTKIELTAALAGDADVTQATVAKVLAAIESRGQTILAEGGEFVLPGLGRLSVETRQARQGTNPRTGEKIDIAAKRVAKFAPAKALRDRLNGSAGE